jgi:hypothetical protein
MDQSKLSKFKTSKRGNKQRTKPTRFEGGGKLGPRAPEPRLRDKFRGRERSRERQHHAKFGKSGKAIKPRVGPSSEKRQKQEFPGNPRYPWLNRALSAKARVSLQSYLDEHMPKFTLKDDDEGRTKMQFNGAAPIDHVIFWLERHNCETIAYSRAKRQVANCRILQIGAHTRRRSDNVHGVEGIWYDDKPIPYSIVKTQSWMSGMNGMKECNTFYSIKKEHCCGEAGCKKRVIPNKLDPVKIDEILKNGEEKRDVIIFNNKNKKQKSGTGEGTKTSGKNKNHKKSGTGKGTVIEEEEESDEATEGVELKDVNGQINIVVDPYGVETEEKPVRRGYTWCTHRAEVCDCYESFDVAIATHSIYYNTEQEVFDLTKRMNSRRMYAIVHRFDKRKAAFVYEGLHQGRYRKVGEQVEMCAEGDGHVYRHPDCEWIFEKESYSSKSGTLFWTTEKVGEFSHLVTFTWTDLVVDSGKFKEPAPIELGRWSAPLGMVYGGSVPIEDGRYIPNTKHSVKIPEELLDRVLLAVAGSFDDPIDKKALATSRLRAEIKKAKLNSLSSEISSIVMAVTGYADDLVLKLTPKYTQKRKVESILSTELTKEQHFSGVSREYLTQYVGTTRLSFLWEWYSQYFTWPGFKAWLKYLVVDNPLYAMTIFLAILSVPTLLSCLLAVVAALFPFAGVLGIGIGPVSTVGYIGILGWLVIYIIFKWLFAAWNATHTTWKDLHRCYTRHRRLINYEGPVDPDLDTFDDIDSLLDVDDGNWPMDPKAKLNMTKSKPKLKRPSVKVVGVVYDTAMPSMFSASMKNSEVSLRTRVLLDVPKGDGDYWDEVRKLDAIGVTVPRVWFGGEEADFYADRVVISDEDHKLKEQYAIECDYRKWVSRFPPSKREMYARYHQKFFDGQLMGKHYHYEMFVKREFAVDVTQEEYIEGRPRAIQAASWPLKLISGPVIYACAEATKISWNKYNDIFYASGITADDLNDWFNFHVDRFDRPVFLGTDFSKYDLTQGEDAIEREIYWMKRMRFDEILRRLWGDNQRVFEHWLRCKRLTRGYGGSRNKKNDNSIFYEIPYKRKSGESETSLFNSWLTAFVIVTWLLRNGIVKKALAVLGDDNLAILEYDDLIDKFGSLEVAKESLALHATRLGFKLKIDMTQDDLCFEFLSLRFYPTINGYRVGKKPGRNLAKLGFMKVNNAFKEEDYLPIWYATLISYRATSMHVPFLRVYLEECMSLCKDLGVIPNKTLAKFSNPYKIVQGTEQRLDESTWDSFQLKYGFTKADENQFREALVKHLKKNGLKSCMHSRFLEVLWREDLDG